MSSHAVATSTRGLPDLPDSPIDLDDFDPPWPDQHDLDRPSAATHNQGLNAQDASPSTTTASRPSWSTMDNQQRNAAVGNLLAALAPPTSTQTATTPTKPDPDTLTQNETKDPPPIANPEPDQSSAGQPPADETSVTDPSASLPVLPDLAANSYGAPSDQMPAPLALPLDTSQEQTNFMSLNPMAANIPSLPPPIPEPIPERREIEAFAKIEFEDGNYYITTYACELGRDAFAYRAALARAEEARQAEQDRGHSSSGRISDGIPRQGDSQVQGSVISEAGGFGGMDDGQGVNDGNRDPAHPSHSSEISADSIVKPQEVLFNPPLIPFDYHRMAERQAQLESGLVEPDNEQPAPVTADHIPDANNCPLIPIHAMRNFQKSEVENHRSISRRHVKIQWDFDRECFQMKVLGRNGAFLDDEYLLRGAVKRLRDGSRVQISNVWMTFRLPNQQASPISDDSDREAGKDQSPVPQRSTSMTTDDGDRKLSPSRSGKTKTKITLTTTQKPSPSIFPPPPSLTIGPDGQPIPPKKRGPGRPPKNGIMSKREEREREKAMKLAEAKAANGGSTPPPLLKGKFPKPIVKEEEPVKEEPKPEKRKYKKRKRPGEDGDVVQSIEGGEVDVPSEAEKPVPKKARASKSPSPEYPPAESLTEEQLARPSEPYARLIYDILIDIHPKALPLKQIYRALKLKFPFFVHRVDSEGWQSSVRHNLNQEWNKLFEKGEKEGKGFAWKAIPGALQPQAERRRAAQQAAASKPKPPPAPRQHPQGPPPPLNWQNSTPYPQQNGMPPRGPPPPFFMQGPHGQMPPPPNGMPWPPPPGAIPPPGGAPQQGTPGQAQPFYPTGARPPYPPPGAPGAIQHPATPTPGASASGPSTPAPGLAPLPTSSSASNMPCTMEGIVAIRRFEAAMYQQVNNPEANVRWQAIFGSVKRRLLHGAPHSLMPEGETKEERTIVEHVARFIDRFKNPAFVGFSASTDSTRGTSSPAPASSVPAKATPPTTTVQASQTPSQPKPEVGPSPTVARTDQGATAQAAPTPGNEPKAPTNVPANVPAVPAPTTSTQTAATPGGSNTTSTSQEAPVSSEAPKPGEGAVAAGSTEEKPSTGSVPGDVQAKTEDVKDD
ncbi:hypothetical protein B0A52_01108 [Exophiala mesophila]|uniref:Fork-head domain-containing protein n=1 Tax=Exophiala mesophila TaxID=212818 RepID=A0A438NGH5_EXOME|nr:hypothetical protein B0A52_01108 [Exophiala mesophila]